MLLTNHYNKTNFQGIRKSNSSRYFEGWYFKQTSEDESSVISFIPGISINKKDPHSFVQCIYRDAEDNLETSYFRYTLEEFEYSLYPFEIRVGDCIFNKSGMSISLENESMNIRGAFSFGCFKEIVRTPLMPNIMGIFSYVPYMECNHEVVSMNHWVNGVLMINDKEINWGNGSGYIEKDWGRSFPKSYLWVQSNNFEYENVSFMCSMATIPFGVFSFEGFFCNIVVNNIEYRFATYNGSKMKVIKKTKDYFDVVFIGQGVKLEVRGLIKKSGILVSPKNGGMLSTIKEGLGGEVQIVMRDHLGQLIVNAKSYSCGIELE